MASIARQSILYRLRRDIPEPAGGTLICRTEKTMRILGDAPVDADTHAFAVELQIGEEPGDALVRELLETAPEAAMRTTAVGA